MRTCRTNVTAAPFKVMGEVFPIGDVDRLIWVVPQITSIWVVPKDKERFYQRLGRSTLFMLSDPVFIKETL